jgi:hypothetical protein
MYLKIDPDKLVGESQDAMRWLGKLVGIDTRKMSSKAVMDALVEADSGEVIEKLRELAMEEAEFQFDMKVRSLLRGWGNYMSIEAWQGILLYAAHMRSDGEVVHPKALEGRERALREMVDRELGTLVDKMAAEAEARKRDREDVVH